MVQYMGGKSKIAAKLAKYLTEQRKPGQLFIEPFIGAANIFVRMAPPKQGYDLHPELVALLKAAQAGWVPPSNISEEEWRRLKEGNGSPELRGFAGFACSFGGRWFESFARDPAQNRNFAITGARNLDRKRPGLQAGTIEKADYRSLKPSGALIYCDPPYKGVKTFSGCPAFDHDEFWATVRQWSASNDVFVSEQQAPQDFDCVWEGSVYRTTRHYDGVSRVAAERLFHLKPPANDNK